MKKIFFSIILFLSIQQSFACEICGCSSGNYFIGPFAKFHKHFLGVRYTFRSFKSTMAMDETQYSKDFYQTTELTAGWNIGKKWQLLAFVPYNINKQNTDDGIKQVSGLGDVSMIANYKLFNTNTSRTAQQLWIGGGIKLATGQFNIDPTAIVTTANNQPGTGTTDFLLNTMYIVKLNNWGINSSATYKINGTTDAYQTGNKLSATAFVYRTFKYKSGISFNPNAGLLFETANASQLSKINIEATGGNSLSAAAGLEMNFNKIAVGFNAQLPLKENLSDKQTTTNLKGMIHVSFSM